MKKFLLLLIPFVAFSQTTKKITFSDWVKTGGVYGYPDSTKMPAGPMRDSIRIAFSTIDSLYTIVPDTTKLKTTSGNTAYLKTVVVGKEIGGGMFVKIDSTYPEGVVAFDHPTQGKQWVREEYLRTKSVNIGWVAIGDGITDNRVAIQAALDAGKGGIVIVPEGIYIVSSATHPVDGAYKQGLIIGSNTTLRGVGSSSIIKLQNSSVSASPGVASCVIRNYNIASGDSNITISDIIVDGNASGQSINSVQGGINLLRVTKSTLKSVTVKNCRGTSNSGYRESFFFDVGLSSDVMFMNCMALGNPGDSTASGFSANSSTGVQYVNCIASNMTVANGFTHNGCANIQYVNCYSYKNAGYGFNSEVSKGVTYIGCIAGGRSSSAGISYPFEINQDLGNTGFGFAAIGSSRVQYVGCIGDNNKNLGLYVGQSSSARIIGGSFSANSTFGIGVDASSSDSTMIVVTPALVGNVVGAIALPTGNIISITGNASIANHNWFNGQVGVGGNYFTVNDGAGIEIQDATRTQIRIKNTGVNGRYISLGAGTTGEDATALYDFTLGGNPLISWKDDGTTNLYRPISLVAIKNRTTSTTIDSFKVVVDTLKFYVGGVAYKAVR